MPPSHLDPFRWGVPEASCRHRRIEAEGFIEHAVEVVEVLQAFEVVDGG